MNSPVLSAFRTLLAIVLVMSSIAMIAIAGHLGWNVNPVTPSAPTKVAESVLEIPLQVGMNAPNNERTAIDDETPDTHHRFIQVTISTWNYPRAVARTYPGAVPKAETRRQPTWGSRYGSSKEVKQKRIWIKQVGLTLAHDSTLSRTTQTEMAESLLWHARNLPSSAQHIRIIRTDDGLAEVHKMLNWTDDRIADILNPHAQLVGSILKGVEQHTLTSILEPLPPVPIAVHHRSTLVVLSYVLVPLACVTFMLSLRLFKPISVALPDSTTPSTAP